MKNAAQAFEYVAASVMAERDVKAQVDAVSNTSNPKG